MDGLEEGWLGGVEDQYPIGHSRVSTVYERNVFCVSVPGKETLASPFLLASATESTHKWTTPGSFRIITNMRLVVSTETHNIYIGSHLLHVE